MARILLIDDDDAVRTVLYLTLTNCGHTVIEARDGKEGLELFKGANVDPGNHGHRDARDGRV